MKILAINIGVNLKKVEKTMKLNIKENSQFTRRVLIIIEIWNFRI